jgi:hypothetical protein
MRFARRTARRRQGTETIQRQTNVVGQPLPDESEAGYSMVQQTVPPGFGRRASAVPQAGYSTARESALIGFGRQDVIRGVVRGRNVARGNSSILGEAPHVASHGQASTVAREAGSGCTLLGAVIDDPVPALVAVVEGTRRLSVQDAKRKVCDCGRASLAIPDRLTYKCNSRYWNLLPAAISMSCPARCRCYARSHSCPYGSPPE